MADKTVEGLDVTAIGGPKFSASRFISKIRPTRRVHFDVLMSAPSCLLDKYSYSTNMFALTAVSTNIPTVSLDNTVIRRGTVSNKEAFPTNVSFGDLSITFYSDDQGHNLTIFKDWIECIFPVKSGKSTDTFSVPYKADYVTDIEIKHYDPFGKILTTYKFEEAFPETIADVPLNWGSFNDIVTQSIDFKYSKYSVENAYMPEDTSGQKYTYGGTGTSQNSRLPTTMTIKDTINAAKTIIKNKGY